MKTGALLFCIFLSILSSGQGMVQPGKLINGKYRYTFVYSVYNRSADNIYHVVKRYVSRNGSAFTFLGGDPGKSWTAENGKTVVFDSMPFAPVFDDSARKITAPVTFRYVGDGVGCVGVIVGEGLATFSVKEGKCMFDLSGLNYKHLSAITGDPSAVEGVAGQPCPAAAGIESLFSCGACRSETDEVFSMLFTNYRELVRELHASFKQYVKSSAQDF